MQTSNELSEQEELEKLLARVALKDRQAFALLYDKVSTKLFSVAMAMLGQRDQAEEALQESFIKIWHNADQYRSDKGSPLVWMRAIVRYRVLDLIDSRQRHETSELNDDLPSIGDDILRTHNQQALNLCLGGLSVEARDSIVSAYIYGYSREEIAQKANAGVNTVKSWLKRGLKRLEECLRQHAT